MLIPATPVSGQMRQLSPSLYEAGSKCLARLCWQAFGKRKAIPQHPAALLGTAFHAVVELANKGELSSDVMRRSALARDRFDAVVRTLHAEAHPLIREKFPTPTLLPYYNLFRERASRLALSDAVEQYSSAATASEPLASKPSSATPLGSGGIERKLTSRDGLLSGRVDRLDLPNAEVVDYKTGNISADQVGRFSDSELRQLRLYVYLAEENGLSVSRGTIVRGTGLRVTQPIPLAEASQEADRARALLVHFNNLVASGATFDTLATPSSPVCAGCPCIPLCDAFWKTSDPGWVDACGVNAECRVVDVTESAMRNGLVVSFEVETLRGTVAPGIGTIQQVPRKWLLLSQGEDVEAGDVVRVVNARSVADGGSLVLAADRTATAIWRLPRDNQT